MMLDSLVTDPLFFVIWFAAVVIVIGIHEFAHAFSADRLGDPTPAYNGRLTLNPLVHLDPIGTLILVFSGYGWGRPVQINPLNFEKPSRDTMLVSLAGPASNLILATVVSIFLHIVPASGLPDLVFQFCIVLIKFNILLAVFNLLPVAPLDGFKVVAGLLPYEHIDSWMELENYGIFILVVLILPLGGLRILDLVIGPPIALLERILLAGIF